MGRLLFGNLFVVVAVFVEDADDVDEADDDNGRLFLSVSFVGLLDGNSEAALPF